MSKQMKPVTRSPADIDMISGKKHRKRKNEKNLGQESTSLRIAGIRARSKKQPKDLGSGALYTPRMLPKK